MNLQVMSVENITEVTYYYMTFTNEDRNTVFEAAHEQERAKLNRKAETMKLHMLEIWKNDINLLKAEVRHRMSEEIQMKLLESGQLPAPVNSQTITRTAFQQQGRAVARTIDHALKEMERHPDRCRIRNANPIENL